MSTIDVNQLLSKMQAMASRVQDANTAPAPDGVESTGFSDLLKQSVEKVNENSMNASKMSEAFVRQDPDVNLAEVMVALQKASVSFQAMTEVRNKLVKAYQEIMNMNV